MKIKKIIISLVVIIAVILGFIKINNEPNKDAEIKIGLISILSGDYSAIGESFANGVKLAQEEYALKNPSKKIQLIIEDDGFEAIKGVSAYKKLTEVNNVDAVINLSSPTIGSIYDEVIEDGIPLIQTGEQPVKPTADNVYQVMPYSVISANALGAELNKSYSADEVALVYMNEPTYKTFADAFVEGFGNKIKNVYITKNDNNDFKTEALKISNSNSKIIVFYVTETETAFLIKEMKKFGNESKYAFGLVTETLDKYKEVVGDTNILNGTIVPVFKSNTDQEFVNKYNKRFGMEPGFGADLGYDAFTILASTYENNSKDWLNNIQKIDIEGVTGKIKFDKNGTRAPEFSFRTIENGELPE